MRSRPSGVISAYDTSTTIAGRIQWTRLNTCGEPNRPPREGGSDNGILAMQSDWGRPYNRSGFATGIPVLPTDRVDQLAIVWL